MTKVCESCGNDFRSGLDYDIPHSEGFFSICASCIAEAVMSHLKKSATNKGKKKEDSTSTGSTGAWWA